MKISRENSGKNSMHEEVQDVEATAAELMETTSTVVMRERLEKIQDLANQFQDDDLHWTLQEIADQTRGKLIDPETARGTWMYEDPFDRMTPGQVIDQLKTATWFAAGENGYVQKCEIGDLNFYSHPDGCCTCADGGLWVSALFVSPEAAASWSDDWDGAEELFRKQEGNFVPMKGS